MLKTELIFNKNLMKKLNGYNSYGIHKEGRRPIYIGFRPFLFRQISFDILPDGYSNILLLFYMVNDLHLLHVAVSHYKTRYIP